MSFGQQLSKSIYIRLIRLSVMILLIYSVSFSKASGERLRFGQHLKSSSPNICISSPIMLMQHSLDMCYADYQFSESSLQHKSMSNSIESHPAVMLMRGKKKRKVFMQSNSSAIELGSKPVIISSGDTEIVQNRHLLGAFEVLFKGHVVAESESDPVIVYSYHGKLYTVQAKKYEATAVRMSQGGLRVNSAIRDQNGVSWGIYQNFFPGPDSSIKVHCLITVNKPCILEYLPIITILPDEDDAGLHTKAALLPGVLYWGAHQLKRNRIIKSGDDPLPLVPQSGEMTFPLMTVVGRYGYISLAWRQAPHVAALFACPNGLYNSNFSELGLVAPGSSSTDRSHGKLLANPGLNMTPGMSIGMNARIMCGEGRSVVPSLKEYVKEYGLPGIPSTHMSAMQYLTLAADGWLKSNITASPYYRKAWSEDSQLYPPKPAADAAMDMLYDSTFQNNRELASKLENAASASFSSVNKNHLLSDQISDVKSPGAALVDMHAMSEANQAYTDAKSELAEDTGIWDKVDGDVAEHLCPLLQNALVCGDPEIIKQALVRLRMLDRYNNRLPSSFNSSDTSGIHATLTASASLCRACVLGYALSGDATLLSSAEYWAWSGLPFVYLDTPKSSIFGDYSTKASCDINNYDPVKHSSKLDQRRGIDYADALWMLSEYDLKHSAQWRQIADGITSSGIIQSWPEGSMENGLLPAHSDIANGARYLPAFNPGIVFTGAARLYNFPSEYSFAVSNSFSVIIHAAGKITIQRESTQDIGFNVRCWSHGDSQILIVGLSSQPQVLINGDKIPSSRLKYNNSHGWLVLPVHGTANVELKYQ